MISRNKQYNNIAKLEEWKELVDLNVSEKGKM